MNTRNPVLNLLALAMGLAIANASHGAPAFDPSKQPFGELPRLAVTGFNLSTNNEKAFQVWFDGYNWSGDVAAYPLSTSGRTQTSERLWAAGQVLKSKQACGFLSPSDVSGSSTTWYDTGRIVVTKSSAGANKAFRWASIGAAYQTYLGDATTGPKVLNYIRGDRSNEKQIVILEGDGITVQYQCGQPLGTFRPRLSILGDVIHSRPVYVGPPRSSYLYEGYQAFKSANSTRAPRVYFGANDGMLHALNATTGEEVFAYIPSMLFPKLKQLVNDPYTYTPFVDGTLTTGDVNFGASGSPDWRTVLVGGLGAGGKGLFALDVTSPDAANETFAAAKILWEITPASSGFNDLGDTFGEPVIAQLNTGQWAAIVGNGYNNTASGRAWLYVIDIKTGALIKSFDTGAGSVASPNGLSSPLVVDTNFDGKVDRVYAGDIDGNLWKFDLSAASASSWSVSSKLIATGQAIVGTPDVALHPISGLMIYFATGRIYTPSDACDSSVQNYAYGIWDGAPAANTAILDQTLEEKAYLDIQRVRVSSGKAINWNDATDTVSKPLHRGWRTALPPGERVIGAGFVNDGRFQFLSINPTIVNDPRPNGENWLIELDYLTGGTPNNLIFDLSRDGNLTVADRVTDGGLPVAGAAGVPVAVYMGKGLFSQPTLVLLNAQLSTTLFNSNPFFDPASNVNCSGGPTPILDPGVAGGHFDVDIYNGTTKISHTHEYDDKYNVTGVNFLNPSDPAKDIKVAIGNATTKFKILIANQKYSPAVSFSYGGEPYEKVVDMTQYTTTGLTVASLPTYDRTTVTTLKFNMPVNAFEVQDWAGTGDLRVGLMPTVTGCVNSVNATTGSAGNVYAGDGHSLTHNGALTFQLIKDTTPDSAIQLGDAAGDPAWGYRVKDAQRATYVLAEWTVFWHHPNGKCYGAVGWVKDPPQDTSAPGALVTPNIGSGDPPWGDLGDVTTTLVNTVPDPSVLGNTIRTTTTTFSSGWTLVVTETLDKKGKVIKTVVTLEKPPSGGYSPPCVGVGCTTTEIPPTVTGYQQSRRRGKMGRLTWHELFAQ